MDWLSFSFWGSSILGALIFLLLAAALIFALFLVVRGIVRLIRKILAR